MTFRINDARSPAGRRQGAEPRDPRAADARGRAQRRIKVSETAQGGLRGRGPRRAAAGRPDREHAPRRLRAHGLAAAGAVRRTGRRAAGADRGSHRSMSTRITPASSWRSSASARASSPRCARGRAARPASSFLVPVARPDRLPRRVSDRYPRHGRDEPGVPRLGAHKGPIPGRRNGVLISIEDGVSVPYALFNLEDRGRFFIGAGEQVYDRHDPRRAQPRQRPRRQPAQGQEAHQRPRRRQGRGRGADHAGPPTLEQAIAYVEDDELVEVTPRNIRLRKRVLDPLDRKRQSRQAAS